MKISSIIIFTVLIGLTCLTKTTLSQSCLEYLSPIGDLRKTKMVDCPMVSSIDMDKRQTPDNMFVIDFQCTDTDDVLCKKVSNVFDTAGKFITATINLKSPINVNAKFLDFCATLGY